MRISMHWVDIARFVLLVLLFIAACLWGGGSRLDIPGLMLLQPLAVLVIAGLTLLPGRSQLASIKAPLLLLGALAMIMVFQIIPLPPEMWRALPGHAQFNEIATAVTPGTEWRPISLTPDLTIASLFSLTVPAAALLAFGLLPADRTHAFLPYLLGAVGVSILLGLGQLGASGSSPFYRYAITNEGSAVGLFSNRNHQALLLAMAFPMLALWQQRPIADKRLWQARRWIAVAAAIFLLPMILVTGSRAGLLLMLVGIGFGWLQLRAQHAERETRRVRGRYLMWAATAGLVVAIIASVMLSRSEAIDRLFAASIMDDPRLRHFSTLMLMMRDFLPLGSGFGSFDPVFRAYEPFDHLDIRYFNHAHNDLLELIITGGIPALIVAVLFLIWLARRAVVAFRARSGSSSYAFGHLALAIIVLTLIGSLVDYPLRTPLISFLFAISCGWLVHLKRSPSSSGAKP